MMGWLSQARLRLGGTGAIRGGRVVRPGRRAVRWASADLFPGFGGQPEGKGLAERIRGILEGRNAVALSELAARLGQPADRIIDRLEGMIVAGEVERLRPVRYGGWDRDFFRQKRISDRACLWQQRILAQAGRMHVPV